MNTDVTISLKSFELDDNFLNKFNSIDKMTMSPLWEKFRSSSKIIVDADRSRIIQIMYNLLNNAVRFTNNGEIITTILDLPHKNVVIVEIKDSGAGIDNQIIDTLFSKFVTKSEKGTGLGLFICKNLIEAHGDKIWAKNNIHEKGATFSFALPYN